MSEQLPGGQRKIQEIYLTDAKKRLTGFTVMYTTRGRFASGGIMNEYMDYITEKRRRNTEKNGAGRGGPGVFPFLIVILYKHVKSGSSEGPKLLKAF